MGGGSPRSDKNPSSPPHEEGEEVLSFIDLPALPQSLVFARLSPTDLIRIALTCRRFKCVSGEPGSLRFLEDRKLFGIIGIFFLLFSSFPFREHWMLDGPL